MPPVTRSAPQNHSDLISFVIATSDFFASPNTRPVLSAVFEELVSRLHPVKNFQYELYAAAAVA